MESSSSSSCSSSTSSMFPFQSSNFTPESSSSAPIIIPKIEPIDENPNPTSTPNVQSEYLRLSQQFRATLTSKFDQNGDVLLSVNPDSDPNSRAIVPVPNPGTQLSNNVVRPRGKRSSELVRVMDLSREDKRYFHNLLRRTRMLFESMRVFSVYQYEKHRNNLGARPRRRMRGDLKAADKMRDQGLWLYRDKRIVGDIAGVSVGDVFFYRAELSVVGLHGQPQAGIDYVAASQSSVGEPIATSIIVSGGYEDNEDEGEVIVYTGHGGHDNHNKQVKDQKLEGGNLALERSMDYDVEVRVIRGFKYEGTATGKVYVYDGLYKITDSWFSRGKSGFGVYKFRLVRIENQVEMGSTMMKLAASLRTRPLEVRPRGYVTLDLSGKKENLPVYFYNDVDENHEPVNYQYLVSTVFPPYVYGNNSGCECVEGCLDDCFCATRNGGEFAYDHHGILLRGKPLIFECGPHCQCPPTCRNRVTQKGIRHRFEVFRSRETKWGVRSLDLIPAGSFICEYAGVVLTQEQAQIFRMNGDNLIYAGRFADRWKEWGDLSQLFFDYVCPAYPSIPPLDFAMDVSSMRNLSCYVSHSSSPNVFVQLVLYDHGNVSFPHLMLFAMENIPPMRALSLDYGVPDEWTAKLAICN